MTVPMTCNDRIEHEWGPKRLVVNRDLALCFYLADCTRCNAGELSRTSPYGLTPMDYLRDRLLNDDLEASA